MAGKAIVQDQITQRELRALCELEGTVGAQCEAMRRRILAGATVEPGRLSANVNHEETCSVAEVVKYGFNGLGLEVHPVTRSRAKVA